VEIRIYFMPLNSRGGRFQTGTSYPIPFFLIPAGALLQNASALAQPHESAPYTKERKQ